MILFFPFQRGLQHFKGELSGPDTMGTQIWEVAINPVIAALCPTQQGTPTFKKGPYLTRFKGVPNSFLHLHEFCASRHSFIPKQICQWFQNGNLVYYIQTFMYQLEGSNFKPFPFFNWTQGKGECITCKKEIRRNHLLPIDCTLRVFHKWHFVKIK